MSLAIPVIAGGVARTDRPNRGAIRDINAVRESMHMWILHRKALLVLVLVSAAAPTASAQMLWSRRATASTIYPCSSYPIAYDAARRRVVMLAVPGVPMPPLGQQGTYEWDGFNWDPRKSTNLPNSASADAFAMAYDAARAEIVLFGGSTTLPTFSYGHTWTWNGSDWTRRTPATSPPGRSMHAMAYDTARQRVVMFGGFAQGVALNDTWEWDGTDWNRVFPVFSPPARGEHAMAYDAARARLVLFGGRCREHFGETWVWMGNTWIRKATRVSPPPRCGHAMAYDAERRRVVLFGGQNATGVFGDTWEWSGTDWAPSTSVTNPPGLCYPAMAYHPAVQRMVLYGGRLGLPPNGGYAQDIWEYGATHLYVTGLARPGQVMSIVLLAGADVGRAYRIGSSLGGGPIAVGPVFLGLDADGLLALSVSGACSAIFPGYQGTIDANGQATAAIRIPYNPTLAGATIHTAFLTLDPGRPAGIRSVSNSVAFQIKP
jgi:hypothetical protein